MTFSSRLVPRRRVRFRFHRPGAPEGDRIFRPWPASTHHKLLLGGSWGAYWYNGHIYSSDIGRGLDVFTLKPSQYLTQNEIDAANLVHLDIFNPTTQPRITWPASFTVVRAYLDQLERSNGLAADKLALVKGELDRVEHLDDAQRGAALRKLAKQVELATRRGHRRRSGSARSLHRSPTREPGGRASARHVGLTTSAGFGFEHHKFYLWTL